VEEKCWQEGAQRGAGFFRPDLPRRERTCNWEKRAKIISRGKSIKYDNLYISILPQSAWALSIVVKKNSGKACQRNEFERKIRESFRLCKPYCPNPAAVAVTVLRKPQKIDVNKLTELFKDNINNPSR